MSEQDPWAEFLQPAPMSPANDPWAAFSPTRPPLTVSPDAAIGPMGSDGVSGDELRARNAGNTRATMRPEDIEFAYEEAQRQGNAAERGAMAEAFVRREKADSPIGMAAGDTLRQVAKGVPVLGGLADEANAATGAAWGLLSGRNFGSEYEKGMGYQSARDRVFEQDNPWTSTGLQVGGGIASGLGAAAKIAPMVGNMSRAALLGTGLGGGAALGAADGFTRGQGIPDRITGAGLGGLVGGFLGAAAPAVAGGVSKGTGALLDALTTNRQLSRMGLDRPSADVLARALMADDTFGQRGAANIAKAGPMGMVADAGPNAAAILDTTIQRGGPGATEANRALTRRAGQAGDQVDDALNTYLGRPRESAARDLIVYGDKTNPLNLIYKKAYETPIDYASPKGMAIEQMVKRRVPATAIAKANNLMRVEDEQSKQILAKIADHGTVTFETLPDVRQLDYITRALNDVAKAGDGQGALGGNTAEGRAYKNLSRDIRSTLRDLVPEYGKALDRASDEIGNLEALKFGGGLLSRSVTRDEAADEIKGLTRPQLERARQGIRNHIDETVANVKKTMTDPNLDARQAVQALRDLSSDAAREKVGLVIGEGEARKLFGQLDEAAKAFELRAAVARNSATFARTVTNDTIKDVTEPGAIGTLAQAKPVHATQRLVQALLGTGPEAQVAKQDQIYSRLARALTEPQGQGAQDFTIGLENAYQRRGKTRMLADILGGATAGGLTGGGYAYANRLLGSRGRE